MTDACRVCPARLAEEAGHVLGMTLSDVVPPDAQAHLLNAQRELLLALIITVEHNASRVRRQPAKGGRKRGSASTARRPKRVAID